MPPEPLPFDRKDFFKERKPSSSDPVGVVPARWRESPTTPSSHHKNHGSFSSYRWGCGGGGSSDFRRPFSGGKKVGGGWHVTTAESGPREDKYCNNNSSVENNNNNSRTLMVFSSQKDRKGGISCETTASPNGNSHPHSDFVNSWDQLQSKDQHDKNNGVGASNTGGQRLERENSLGSSINWKPLKWARSGSLSSRGSGFSHSSSSKSIGADSLDTKIEAQPGNSAPLRSPSGDAAPCLTPRTLADEASFRKKARLGWGEGLAKYEKKKVGPDDIIDKDVGARNGMVDGVSNSEPLLPRSANLPDKSPSLTGCSECASPATPYSFACSSSPGLEEKASIKEPTVDSDICNPSVPSSRLSQNHTEGTTFNLENLELTEVVDLSSPLNELLQSDDSSALGSGFVRSTAMDKLQVWKADISRTLEITETEIDSLEYELKSLISDLGGSSHFPAASSSLPTECTNKNTQERSTPSSLRINSSEDTHMEKADGSIEEHTEVEYLDRESPGTATSKLVKPITTHSDAVEQSDCPVNLDITSQDRASDDILGVVTASGDGSLSTVSVDGVHYGREDKLYGLILASNKVLANRASDEFSKLVPTSEWCTNISRATNEPLVKEKLATRKRFLRFKERVITLKFRTFQYIWKEDLNLLSVRRLSAKSQKKFELSSRMGFTDYQKQRSSIRSRFSLPAGSLSLVPTTEILDYTNKLLSDSCVRVYRNTLKMPSLILDKREQITSRFISDNALVENPCDVEKERSVINPWTLEEKEVFLHKFALFGKDFKKIASFLEHKTIADCVEFYYKNHKSDRFQKTKKNPEFPKQAKTHSTNTYLVTSGKRWSRETNAAALDILGAASAMAASTSKFYSGHNERETAAADVLAGICGSISSEALSSCITSSDVYHQDRRFQKLGEPEPSQNDVDEETCSDDNCEGETDSSNWTDEEKLSFVQAVASYGKDFSMISRCMRTRSVDQCKVFFSKARKCLGLEGTHHEPGNEGTTDVQQGGGSDHDDDTCMVDSGGSVVSHDKSSSECKINVEDLHSSDSKEEERAESDQNVVNECRDGCEAENKPELDLEEAEAPRDTYSEGPSASGADVEAETVVKAPAEGLCASREVFKECEQLPDGDRFNGDASKVSGSNSCPAEDLSFFDLSIDHGNNLEMNVAEKPHVVSQVHDNGFLTSSLIPDRKTLSQDDISSRLSFRKSGDRFQRSSSTDGYHLHRLPKRSLLDSVESSQILSSYPVNKTTNGTLSYDEPQNKIKLDSSLLSEHCLPRDCSLQIRTNLTCDVTLSQEQRPSSSSDAEKPTRSGDVKLFGQILTNPSPHQPQEKPNGVKPFNLKLDNHNNRYFGMEKNLPVRSYGFWDGNRIQTGFQSMPDSALLLAKYPAAFGNTNASTSFKLEPHQQLRSSGNMSGFETREANYHAYRRQDVVQLACNGVVSDPVAAIRMHYAKTEQLKNGVNGGGDIGSR